MGLFSKKKTSDDSIQQELDALKERLAETERAKAELEGRLSALDGANATLAVRITTLDEANAALDARLGTLDHGFGLLGDQLGSLTATNERLGQRLTAVDDLDARLRELTDRLNTPVSAPPPAPVSSTPSPPPPTAPTIPPPPAAAPPPPPPTPDATIDDERLDDIAAQLELLAGAVAAHTESLATTQARLAEIDELDELLAAVRNDRADTDEEEIAALRQQLADVTERVSGMDTRVTSVSTELANQLTELSRDIDELTRRSQEAADAAAAGGSDAETSASVDIDAGEIEARLAERLDAAIDDVLDTTERLAAEQARYEIQFRADLAELAERLRRPNAH